MPISPELITALDEFEVQLDEAVDKASRALDQERRFLISVRDSFGEVAVVRRQEKHLLLRATNALRTLVGGS